MKGRLVQIGADLCRKGVKPSLIKGYYEAVEQIGYRYFYRKGFLEGEFGLRMAIMSGLTRFLVNAKHIEKAARFLSSAES